MSRESAPVLGIFIWLVYSQLVWGPYGLNQAVAFLSAFYFCWRMYRELRADTAELDDIMDQADPLYGCPLRHDPRYAHIDPLKVIKKRWDLMTELDKDIDFWMRCNALQDRLERNGDFVAASKLRARYEEVMQEDHDMEHRAFPATGAGR